jgi:hypothetical protein
VHRVHPLGRERRRLFEEAPSPLVRRAATLSMRIRGAFENPIESELRDRDVPGFTVECPACKAWLEDRKVGRPFAGERELARMHHALMSGELL